MEYRLLLDLEVVEFVQALPKRERNSLVAHFHRIRDFPSNCADYFENDSEGREVAISIHGRIAIHYWIDFADRHVKVLALQPAEPDE